jgi:arylformamidase
VDQLNLADLNGPCYVVEVGDQVRSIDGRDLELLPAGTTRLLLKTSNSQRWKSGESFFTDFVGLGTDAAGWLLRRPVRLIGIDSLSIENDPTGNFPIHRQLLTHSILILEGLRLADVEAGPYELRCLPLRIEHGDGAPARAVLISP